MKIRTIKNKKKNKSISNSNDASAYNTKTACCINKNHIQKKRDIKNLNQKISCEKVQRNKKSGCNKLCLN